MRNTIALFACLFAAASMPVISSRADGLTKPNLVLQQTVTALPGGHPEDVRVLTAVFKPGDRTVTHTHRFPVTVYVLAGAFTLEMDGKEPVVVPAGKAYLEPPNVKMTGYNRSHTDETKVVIFYVSEPKTPFLDPVR